jgi:type II secretory pathway pseudopilin PulG
MDKPINSTMHGAMDYTTVMTTAAAPHLLGFSKEATRSCAALAAGYLGLSMFTDYKLAAKRAIPFKAHGIAEAAMAWRFPSCPGRWGSQRTSAAETSSWG